MSSTETPKGRNELPTFTGANRTKRVVLSAAILPSLSTKLDAIIDPISGLSGREKLTQWISSQNNINYVNGSTSDMFTQLANDLNNKNILEVVIDQQGRLSFVIQTDGVTHDLVTIQRNIDGNLLIQKYNRAYNPNATNAYIVPASQNRLVPNYNRTQYMDPICQNVINQIGGQGIRIKMTRGNRLADYTAADNIIKQYVSDFRRPSNYTWHHIDDLVVDINGDAWCSMQLVQTTAHSAAGMRHSGSVAQLEKFYLRNND